MKLSFSPNNHLKLDHEQQYQEQLKQISNRLKNIHKNSNQNVTNMKSQKYQYLFDDQNKNKSNGNFMNINILNQNQKNNNSISSYQEHSIASEYRKNQRNQKNLKMKSSHMQEKNNINQTQNSNLRNHRKNLSSQRSHSYNKSISTTYEHPQRSYYNYINLNMKKSLQLDQNSSEIHKAQSQILQTQKVLNNQKFQIEALTQQLQFYLRTCQSNKKELQIQQNKKQVMTTQYQQQIQLLLQEKDKLSQILNCITLQVEQKLMFQQNQINMKREINKQIAYNIDILLGQKELILSKIKQADLQFKYLEENVLFQQEQKIDQLRNIQRKFNIALKQLQRLQKKKLSR